MSIDAIDALINREAGYVDHPADRGGPTKYGITQETLARWRGHPVTADEVAALTREEARTIYLQVYAPGLERIQHLDALYRWVLDVAVLSGPGTAVKLLQRRLNALGGAGLAVDGVLGPITAMACEAAAGPRLLQALVVARIPQLVEIVEGDPSQLPFLRGWQIRTLSFLPEIPEEKKEVL